MSGPQWYPRVVRRCDGCFIGEVPEEGIEAVHREVCDGYVDVDATEECDCAEKGYGRWDSSNPETDCADCGDSGRVPSLAALALRLDSVLVDGDDRVWQVIRCDWVADTVDLFHEMAMDETGPVGHHRTVAWSAVTARVVTVDEVERRGRFAWRGEK